MKIKSMVLGPVQTNVYFLINDETQEQLKNAGVSEKVIDLFDAAGIKKPDISILSEEFLMELSTPADQVCLVNTKSFSIETGMYL